MAEKKKKEEYKTVCGGIKPAHTLPYEEEKRKKPSGSAGYGKRAVKRPASKKK